MKTTSSQFGDADLAAKQAAEWALRHDRGMTASEQDEFYAWLGLDSRNSDAWAEHRWGWEELDRLAGIQTSLNAIPDPELLRPLRARFTRTLKFFIPIAAALMLGLFWWATQLEPKAQLIDHSPSLPFEAVAFIEERTLSDGSVVALNRGAEVHEDFSIGQRKVRLNRGEATFTVTHDASRPFIVEANGVAVRAVGTVFNVRLESSAVEVLVTEGKVRVKLPTSSDGEAGALVGVNQFTIVSLQPHAVEPQVVGLSMAEIDERLAWQPRWLDFTNAPLSSIVAEFNRRNDIQITIEDSKLADLPLSATFRSNNIEGFVRLMESNFGIQVVWRGKTRIALSKAD
jgi:transmembrane sensor